MKLKELLLGASALTVLSVVSTSCTSEMVTPYPGTGNGNIPSALVHTPDIYAWSGNQTLGDSRSSASRFSRAGAITIQMSEIASSSINQAAEKAYIDEQLPEETDNLPDYLDNDFLFYTTTETTVDLYPVYAQTSHKHELGLFYYTPSGEMEFFKIWDEVNPWGLYQDGKCLGKRLIIPAGVFFGLYIDKENTLFTKEHPYGTDPGKLYSSSNLNPYSYHVKGNGDWGPNTDGPMSNQHAVVWTKTLEDGSTQNYLGFEDWCDFDFQDLVFTLTPEVKTVDASDFKPGETEIPDGPTTPPTPVDPCPNHECDHPGTDHNPDGTCPKCEEEGSHSGTSCNPGTTEKPDPCPNHECDHPGTEHNPDGTCPKCEEEGSHSGTSCNPGTGGDTGDNPGLTPGEDGESIVLHNDEVEVNFSINDVHTDINGQKYDTADLWTKLSIHVRKSTDVKVHVPLNGAYFCESDDFAIMQNHADANYTGVGLESETPGTVGEDKWYRHQMTYTINGTYNGEPKTWTVTLHVDIDLSEGDDNEGMYIWTDGIEQEGLIDYLFETNGDGINFEIWNYFQTETVDWIDGQKHVEPTLTQEEYDAFQSVLDASTIEFLDAAPSYYINAFGYDWINGTYNTDIRPRDCLVTPKDLTLFDMFDKFCYHLNGTPWNIIWTKKSVDKTSDDYKHHTITADPAVEVNKY